MKTVSSAFAWLPMPEDCSRLFWKPSTWPQTPAAFGMVGLAWLASASVCSPQFHAERFGEYCDETRSPCSH